MTFSASFSQPPLFDRWPVHQQPKWHMLDGETGMVILVGKNGYGEFFFSTMVPAEDHRHGMRDVVDPAIYEARLAHFIDYEGYEPGPWYRDGYDLEPTTLARRDEMIAWWNANHHTFEAVTRP